MENSPKYWSNTMLKQDNGGKEEISHNAIEDLLLENILQNDNDSMKNVLEAGCGNGRILLPLSKKFDKINFIGCDFSEDLLFNLKNSAKSLFANNITIVNSDIRNIPLENGSIDVYCSFGVYEHFVKKDQIVLFKEAKRLLVNEGLFYIEVPYFYSLWTIRRGLRSLYRRIFPPQLVYQKNMKKNDITKKLIKEGFKIEQIIINNTYLSFQYGLSLNRKKLHGLVNPFFFFEQPIRRLSNFLEKKQLMGLTLTVVARKLK